MKERIVDRTFLTNGVTAFAIPYREIVTTMIDDEVFRSIPALSSVMGTHIDSSLIREFLNKVVLSWLDDTVNIPLEDAISGTTTPSKAEALFSNITTSYETDIEVYELILAYPMLATFFEAIEDAITSNYDVWNIDICKRFIYVTYLGDFRIHYFDKYSDKKLSTEKFIELRASI